MSEYSLTCIILFPVAHLESQSDIELPRHRWGRVAPGIPIRTFWQLRRRQWRSGTSVLMLETMTCEATGYCAVPQMLWGLGVSLGNAFPGT